MAQPRQKKQKIPHLRKHRIPVVNASASTMIPAFGLVRITGTNSKGASIVDKPNVDGQDVYINGPLPIPASGYGVVSKDWPQFAAYDSTSGTPAVGDNWGAASGSYLLTKGKTGLAVQGNPNAVRKIVLVAPAAPAAPVTAQWVKVTSATPSTVTIGTGTVTAYPAVLTSFSTTTGAWTDTITAVWFYPVNGDIPVNGNRYDCVSFGTATDGKAVWGEDIVSEKFFVKLSSITPATVTVGGQIFTLYPANYYQNLPSGTTNLFSLGTCWLWCLNAEDNPGATPPIVPVLNWYYEAQIVGFDSSGTPVFAEAFLPPATTTSWGVVTTASQNFSGIKDFTNGVIIDGLIPPGASTNSGNALSITASCSSAGFVSYISVPGAGGVLPTNVAIPILSWLGGIPNGGGGMLSVHNDAFGILEGDVAFQPQGAVTTYVRLCSALAGVPFGGGIIFSGGPAGVPDLGLGGAPGGVPTFIGQNGSFTSADGKTITVTSGLITAITATGIGMVGEI